MDKTSKSKGLQTCKVLLMQLLIKQNQVILFFLSGLPGRVTNQLLQNGEHFPPWNHRIPLTLHWLLYYRRLIWVHSLTTVCWSFQVIMRSSQPLTGTNGRRCKEDEKLINATLRAGKRGYIIDTRSLNVAQQARAKGGGFEQEVHYPQWRRIHKSIER